MIQKTLGKITSIDIEYEDTRFGLSVTLEGNGCGCVDFVGNYDIHIEATSPRICKRILQLMNDAKVTKLSKLLYKPVEIIYENDRLKEWRILTEVL